ncbi:hypothetical protein DESC_880057 [Desulfosarcina cetonica]|nr:hypothetical protein DESC_880057 [Desulfosarcina cetonica]
MLRIRSGRPDPSPVPNGTEIELPADDFPSPGPTFHRVLETIRLAFADRPDDLGTGRPMGVGAARSCLSHPLDDLCPPGGVGWRGYAFRPSAGGAYPQQPASLDHGVFHRRNLGDRLRPAGRPPAGG